MRLDRLKLAVMIILLHNVIEFSKLNYDAFKSSQICINMLYKIQINFKILNQSLLAYIDIYNLADDLLFVHYTLIINRGQTFNIGIPIW